MKRSMIAIALSSCILSQCYYDNEAMLYGEQQCSTEPVSFSGSIAPIIQANCISCNSTAISSGGVSLETYQHVKIQATNGNLLGAVTHANGFSPMPKNAPQLSQCNIEAIRAWVEAGSAND